MPKCRRLWAAFAALALLYIGSTPVSVSREAFADVSMQKAIQDAERQFGAKVVRAALSDTGGRRVYVLRLVSADGRVWSVTVDAASGAVR